MQTNKPSWTCARRIAPREQLLASKKKGGNLKSQIANLIRSIAAMQSKTSDDDGENSGDSDVPDNAGDTFGGRQKKRQKKE
jgi:hypothetical protein